MYIKNLSRFSHPIPLALIFLVIAFILSITMAAVASAASPCAKDRVLFLTDSHGLGYFGELMDSWLVTIPDAELQTYALGGSSPPWWFHGNVTPHGYVFNSCESPTVPPRSRIPDLKVRAPSLSALIEDGATRYRRQIVVIEQGGNVPGLPSVYREWGAKMVQTILAHPQNICIWIAPPKMRAVRPAYAEQVFGEIRKGIEDAGRALGLPEGTSPCLLIDSRPFTEYPARSGDGYHYPFSSEGRAVALEWVKAVTAEIRTAIGL